MSDDRARLEAASAELADLAHEEQAALSIARQYLEDLAEDRDHPIAAVIASQLARLEDRRRVLGMELRELGRERGLDL